MTELATDSQESAERVSTELLELLLRALKELGDAGQADRANRLAASAYTLLRKGEPDQAQRINVLMHRLAARS